MWRMERGRRTKTLAVYRMRTSVRTVEDMVRTRFIEDSFEGMRTQEDERIGAIAKGWIDGTAEQQAVTQITDVVAQ